MISRLRSPVTPWVLLAALVALWLLDIIGAPLPRLVRAAGVGCLLAALGIWLGIKAVTLCWNVGEPARTRERRWLLACLALGLVVSFVGISFELIDHPRNDEGVYLANAERINKGALFPATFNYGHFLYYAGALALWVEDSLPGLIAPMIEAVFEVETPFEVDWIVLKSLVALLGALTVPAVFAIGLRIAPPAAALLGAVLAACLAAFSPAYVETSHQVISDVPSGYFATLCLLFVARLVERERLRDYLLAGVAAGLAAGSKYPGGVVAIAIVGVWLYWRIKERSWSWSLALAAGASVISMLAVMPGLLVWRQAAFSGSGLDLLFGFRQYAFGGWLGVQPDSPALWYGNVLAGSFGLPAVLIGLSGVLFLPRESRRRLLLVLPFPLVYLTLIGAMSMVVVRNLQPVLPILAVVLGVGASAWVQASRRFGLTKRWPSWAGATLLAVAVLALPAIKTAAWDVSRTRPGTRELARDWIAENLPDGISILREGYTPILEDKLYHVQYLRFAGWMPDEELFSPAWDYVLLARSAHGRFLEPEGLGEEHQREISERYGKIFRELELVNEWRPSLLRAGAHLFLFRVEALPPVFLDRRRFVPGDAAYVSDEALRRRGADNPFLYTRRWQYAVFKDYFEAGRYRVVLDVDRPPEEGYLYAVTPENEEIGTWDASTRFEIELPADDKYVFRMFLSPPTELRSWRLRKVEGREAEAADAKID